MSVVDAQTDNNNTSESSGVPAPAACLTALFNADADGDKRLNKAEYLNAMLSLSSDPSCPNLDDDLSDMLLAADSAFTRNFNSLKCACFDYRYDDPLCCQVFNFAIRLPDDTYPVAYAHRICIGMAQAFLNECGVPVSWEATAAPTVAPTAIPTRAVVPTAVPTGTPLTAVPTGAPTAVPTAAPTIRTEPEEDTPTEVSPTASPPITLTTPVPTTTESPSSAPILDMVEDDKNLDAAAPGGVEESTASKGAKDDDDDDGMNTSALAASLSVSGVVACAVIAMLAQRFHRRDQDAAQVMMTWEQGDMGADQHSIQAVAVKKAINPFGIDRTEEEISEVTLDDADLEAARAILSEGPVTATSYAQLQFVGGGSGDGGGSVNSMGTDDDDPTGPTPVLPFRHLERENDSGNKNNTRTPPRVRMRRLLNSLAIEEASKQRPPPSPQQHDSTFHDHATPLQSNTTSSRASPVEIFDSQDEDDFADDQPSAAELLRSDSTDSWGAAMRRALGLPTGGGGGVASSGPEQKQHKPQKQEHGNNGMQTIQAQANGDEQEQQELRHHHHNNNNLHQQHPHDLRPVPRALDFDGDSSAPDSSAGGSGWSDGSSTTTLDSQEEDETTTPPAPAGNGHNSDNDKQWEWVRSFGGQFQF